MGFEVARRALAEGAEVVIAGRSAERLRSARLALGSARVQEAVVDIGEQSQVASLLARVGEFDHLVVTAADLPYAPLAELTEKALMQAVRSKFLGPVFAAQASATRIKPGGSITFTSGIAARRPVRGGLAAAAMNGALEGLMRALAIRTYAGPGQRRVSGMDRHTYLGQDRALRRKEKRDVCRYVRALACRANRARRRGCRCHPISYEKRNRYWHRTACGWRATLGLERF